MQKPPSFDFLGDQLEAVSGWKLADKLSNIEAITNREKFVALLIKEYGFEAETAPLLVDVKFKDELAEATYYSKKLNAWMAVLGTRVEITFCIGDKWEGL